MHSLHAYFLRPGDARKPIVYNVDCIRDEKSFTTRSVIAIQNGRAILNMAASFQVAETGFDHQDAAPQPAGPEGITSERELALMVADQIPESIREKILCKKAIEIRPVDPINPFAPEKRKPLRYAWFKAVGRLPDDPMVHQYMLAYASISVWPSPHFIPTDKASGSRRCRWPAWIMQCGSTGISAWTIGFFMSWKAPMQGNPGG